MQKRTNLASVTQIVTNLGVLLGLAVVIYEVNQTNVIARTQLVDAAVAMSQNHALTVMGDDVGTSLARACYTPDEVTQRDTVVLFGYYDALWYGIDRSVHLSSLGYGAALEQVVDGTVARIVSSRPGRAWYQSKRDGEPHRVRSIADAVYERLSETTCADYLGQMLPENDAT